MLFRNSYNLLSSLILILSLIIKALYSKLLKTAPQMTWINLPNLPYYDLMQIIAAIISIAGLFESLGRLITLTLRTINTPIHLWIILLFCIILGLPTSILKVLPLNLIIKITSSQVFLIWYALRPYIIHRRARESGCIAEAKARNLDPSFYNIDHISYPLNRGCTEAFSIAYWVIASDKQRKNFVYPGLNRSPIIDYIGHMYNVLPLSHNKVDSILMLIRDIDIDARKEAKKNSK